MSYGSSFEFVSCIAKGHANYAKKGADIVCSAVSILLRTTVLSLDENVKLNENLKVNVECKERGNMKICVNEWDSISTPFLSFLFSFLEKGFKSLSSEYPSHVRVEILPYKVN